jgi:hypothetical protein
MRRIQSPLQAGALCRDVDFVLAAPPVPFSHFTAGDFDAMALPTGLRFTMEGFSFLWRSSI